MKNKIIIVILFTALVLRCININQSLWLDEAINVIFATKLSLTNLIFSYSIGDFHPPLFHLIIYLVIKFFGNSEIAVRAPSLIFGVLTVYVTYRISLKLFDEKTALIASTLLATSPLAIYYSQEARMYALAGLFASLSVYFFISILKSDKLINWIGFVVFTALMMYSDYIPYLLIPCYVIYIILFKKSITKSTKISFLPAFILIFVLTTPIFYLFSKQFTIGTSAAVAAPTWANVVGPATLHNLLITFVKFTIGRISIDNNYLYGFLFLPIGLFVVTLSIISFFRTSPTRIFLWLWFLGPIILGFVIAFFVPIFAYFRFLFVLPAFYIILSSGIYSINHKTLTRTLLMAFILINLIASSVYFLNAKFQREDWRNATKYAHLNSTKTSLVLFESNYTMSPFDYYNKGTLEAKGALKKWNPQSSSDLENIKELTENKNQVFLFQYLSEITDPESLIFREITDLGFKNTSTHNFNGVGFLYEFNKN